MAQIDVAVSNPEEAQEDPPSFRWVSEVFCETADSKESSQSFRSSFDHRPCRNAMSSPDSQKLLKTSFCVRTLVAEAMRDMDEPGAADVEVDGTNESGSWDESATSWMNAKKSAVRRALHASPHAMDLVAAVRNDELLGAMDAQRRGAHDVRFWAVKVGTPFDLFLLREVPLRQAVRLNDVGSRSTPPEQRKRAWASARRYSSTRPLKRVR